nr:uncharacterized protein LOC109164944 [Ipomoea trifida]
MDAITSSVDLKKMKMDIIDNCLALATNKSKYGNPPANVVFPNWECSIVKGDRDMLNALRKKFMHDILVSNINTHKYSVIQCALEYDHKSFGCAS